METKMKQNFNITIDGRRYQMSYRRQILTTDCRTFEVYHIVRLGDFFLRSKSLDKIVDKLSEAVRSFRFKKDYPWLANYKQVEPKTYSDGNCNRP